MPSLRTAVIVLVIGAGLVGSYLILKQSNLTLEVNDKEKTLTETSKNLGNLLENSPIQWKQALENFISGGDKGISLGTENTSKTETDGDSPVNLTNLVAASLFNQMKGLDEQGKNPFQELDPNDPKKFEIIEKAALSIGDASLFFNQNIDESKLKILNDNSQSAKIAYLESIRTITQKRLTKPSFIRTSDQIVESVNQNCLGLSNASVNRELSEAYKETVGDYLALGVPSDWLELHKKIIIHFKEANLIYGAIADCATDPIGGYLAAQALPILIEKTQGIQDNLNLKIKEVGL